MMFERPISQIEKDSVMTEHDDIDNWHILLSMGDLGRHISFKTTSKCKQRKSLFIMNKMDSTNKEKIMRIAWVITCKHDKREICKLNITIKTWAIRSVQSLEEFSMAGSKATKTIHTISE